MNSDIKNYNETLSIHEQEICNYLVNCIDAELTEAESKVWHGHPVWFIDGNPIVGYSKQKAGVKLMFWSGADFEENGLNVVGQKFKDAGVFYTQVSDIDAIAIKRWLTKSRNIQWDYKNIVKRKGQLLRLK